MAEAEPAERTIVGEIFAYGLRHPIKAMGNTLIAAYGIHLAREWSGHIISGITKQLESGEQQHGENQANEQIKQ